MSTDNKRASFAGGIEKYVRDELDKKLLEWIDYIKDKHNQVVSRIIIFLTQAIESIFIIHTL